MSDDRTLDRTLDALADAADAEALRSVDGRATPSFAAVMARAHRIDPTTVLGQDVAAGQGNNTLLPACDPDTVLDALIGAARSPAKAGPIQRTSQVPPRLVVRPSSRRTRSAMTAAVVSALLVSAAGVVVVLSLRSAAHDQAEDSRGAGSLAAAQTEIEDIDGQASVSPSVRMNTAPKRARAVRTPGLDLLEEIEGSGSEDSGLSLSPAPGLFDVEAVDLKALPTAKSPVALPSPTRRHADRHDRQRSLERLDQQARAALAVGDLAEADAALARLIARGGKNRLVEAAFGDRFPIAHRLYDAAAQRKLWRAYLTRFPNGRFSDDARAGLCRRAAGDASACWHEYLDDQPDGAYRAQAERALLNPETAATKDEQ